MAAFARSSIVITCHVIFIVTFSDYTLSESPNQTPCTKLNWNELLMVCLIIVSSSIPVSSTVNGGVSATSSNSVASSTVINCPAQSFSTVEVSNYTYEIECMFLKRICLQRAIANLETGNYQYQGGDLGIPVGMVVNSFSSCIQVCLRNYSLP